MFDQELYHSPSVVYNEWSKSNQSRSSKPPVQPCFSQTHNNPCFFFFFFFFLIQLPYLIYTSIFPLCSSPLSLSLSLSLKSIMRKPCCEKLDTNKGAWSKQEDQKLVDYIRKHSEGCWRTLPQAAGAYHN
jgi:hypothetical protein